MPSCKRESQSGLNSVGTGFVELAKSRRGGVPVRVAFTFMKVRQVQRKSPRLKGFDYSQPFAYFVTVCTKAKQELFADEALSHEIITCLKDEREATGVKIFAFCLMPNHFRLLISPGDSGMSISRFMGSVKSKTTRIGWKYGVGEKMWQGRFHDHVVRPNEPVKEICEYILNNPVRKKLVNSWKDYRFCGSLDPVPA